MTNPAMQASPVKTEPCQINKMATTAPVIRLMDLSIWLRVRRGANLVQPLSPPSMRNASNPNCSHTSAWSTCCAPVWFHSTQDAQRVKRRADEATALTVGLTICPLRANWARHKTSQVHPYSCTCGKRVDRQKSEGLRARNSVWEVRKDAAHELVEIRMNRLTHSPPPREGPAPSQPARARCGASRQGVGRGGSLRHLWRVQLRRIVPPELVVRTLPIDKRAGVGYQGFWLAQIGHRAFGLRNQVAS